MYSFACRVVTPRVLHSMHTAFLVCCVPRQKLSTRVGSKSSFGFDAWQLAHTILSQSRQISLWHFRCSRNLERCLVSLQVLHVYDLLTEKHLPFESCILLPFSLHSSQRTLFPWLYALLRELLEKHDGCKLFSHAAHLKLANHGVLKVAH